METTIIDPMSGLVSADAISNRTIHMVVLAVYMKVDSGLISLLLCDLPPPTIMPDE